MTRRYISLFLFYLLLAAFTIPTTTAQEADTEKRFDIALLWGIAKTPGTTLPTVSGVPIYFGQGSPGTIQETTTISIPKNLAWQADFGWRVANVGPVALSLELPVTSASTRTANVNMLFTGISSLPDSVPSASSAYFFTPGIRASFLRHHRFSPYAAVGYGLESERFAYAQAEINLGTLSGPIAQGGYPATERTYKGVLDFGGGVNIRMNNHISFRAETRDFRRSGKGDTEYLTTDFYSGLGLIQNIVEPRHTITVLGGLDFHF